MLTTKVVPLSTKPKKSFVLRVPRDSKLGQGLRHDTSEPKTIHQLVLEHFLDFWPKPFVGQPCQKDKESLVMKNVNSSLQNNVLPHPLVKLLPREGVQQKQETVSLCFKADSEVQMVFEDLNVYHSQEECVSTDPAQQPTPEKKAFNESNPKGEVLQNDFREKSSDVDAVDKPCKKGRINTPIPQQRKLRSLLVTIENEDPLEDLSKYVDINITALTQDQKTKRLYTCPVCGKQFHESSYLISHQRTHTGEKPYDCSHCGKRFNHKTNLNKHERIHTGEKPYSCSQCGKNFRQNSHRSRHEGIHIREKIFKCPECGKTFRQNEEFVLHLQSHEVERPYSCKNCGRRFGRLSNCTRHERIHSACKIQKQK
ncbi:zinc finger protein 200 [Nannospalax galili]|uniref:zinc finger protein 200 n=1 Tax=Nannospalax galili TaxID=1026970 RepID=UPI0004ED200F|nr:zinc finger protein 200 [Nannospalax galili]XP_008844206.1 zinc finger protein 200 [Nannospalax galili]XP_029425894.1 zinc finger protein 200 [Nannospalax galili]